MKSGIHKWRGILVAVAAAVLFGASTPLAKRLLPEVSPWLMAGLLYLGSGVGLFLYRMLRSSRGTNASAEASLSRKDVPWLAGAVLCGGIVGPVLLMAGLAVTPASTSSLLLNLEGVFTALLAWFVFRENFDPRIAWGMALITAGAIALSWMGGVDTAAPWGSLAVVGACLAWAIDNNLTRKVSASDPTQIAMIKGLVAGVVNTGLALAMGAKLPAAGSLIATGVVGFLGYGVSLALFVLALRHLGTARTGAYFSLAPFVGALVSILMFTEPVTAGFLIGSLLMVAGVWLHLTERHVHTHEHEFMQHEHSHHHDEHHQHQHGPGDPPGEPHSHWHRHEPMIHSHEHYPDLHHRHHH
ncbi:MAG TPA: EamA family transporter [Roseimicrobium sp.]|nr:EamA family transporter [Roseimicrobium sp.]